MFTRTPNMRTHLTHDQVGALDEHAAEHGGCSSSQLTPRTEAFYNAQRLAQQEESRQGRQHRQARRPVRAVAPHLTTLCGSRRHLCSHGGSGLQGTATIA